MRRAILSNSDFAQPGSPDLGEKRGSFDFAHDKFGNPLRAISDPLIFAAIAIVALIGLSGYRPRPHGATLGPTSAPDGVIEGRVVNGTADAPAESVARLEIILRPFVDDAPQETITTIADAEGRFRFEGLAKGPDHTYVVSARYQGVETFSDPLSFAGRDMILSAQVVVYETTEDDGAIWVERAHLIVDFVEGTLYLDSQYSTSAMRVGELHIFRNDGDRVYVGSEGRGTLRFSLPSEATALRFKDPRMEASVVRTEGGFFDTLPVLPGMRQIFFSYELPLEAEDYRFVKTIEYPTASLDLLVPDVGVEVASDKLVARRPREMGDGAWYLHFSAQDLARGEELIVHLSSPSAMFRTSPPQRAEVVSEEVAAAGVQEIMRWIGLGLAVLSVVCVLGYPRVRHCTWTASTVQVHCTWTASTVQVRRAEEPLEGEKGDLLLALAHLDDTFEAGELAEEEYRRRRGEVKAQLIEVMRCLRGMDRSQ